MNSEENNNLPAGEEQQQQQQQEVTIMQEKEEEEAETPAQPPNEEQEQSQPHPHPQPQHISPFQNAEAHPTLLRYGIAFFMIATLVLLINADVGSGVSADYILIRDGVVVEERELFLASIFSSVKELWLNGSYPLAILIAVTSIAWPYMKLFLAFYAWCMPYRFPKKRERMIVLIDALGKWSFVDIVVLVEIMVAFRSTIRLTPDVTLEIVVQAKWGFYGFVLATMMSLVSTHMILYFHRRVHYHAREYSADSNNELEQENGTIENKNDEERREEPAADTLPREEPPPASNPASKFSKWLISFCVLASLVFYTVGSITKIYAVDNTRGAISFVEEYSVISIGASLPDSVLNPSDAGTRYIQAMWFFLCVVMPLWCSLLFGILFLAPSLSKGCTERIFFMAEIAFAWSCAEVLLISTLFSVLQMPSFGEGLIEADCKACFLVDTEILPGFAYLCIGAVLNVGVNIWLYFKAHHSIYGGR